MRLSNILWRGQRGEGLKVEMVAARGFEGFIVTYNCYNLGTN